jgi:hypothetical protein
MERVETCTRCGTTDPEARQCAWPSGIHRLRIVTRTAR